jgi:alginate O-acetyltransferase complex protein AlgJ
MLLPSLDSIFNFSPVKDLFEKRKPVTKPKIPQSISELKNYTHDFESFFNDNYGFRKTLISWHSKIMDKIFDESPITRVAFGKDGWLYFDNDNSLLDAAGNALLDDNLIDYGVESFAKNWQELRKNNIEYLLVIAADKSTVYKEFLPEYIEPKNNHRIDKFLTALKKKYPDFPVLDLRETLLKAKEKEIIYHKTDTHWNKRGAHYGYVEIMKKLGIKPHLRNEFVDKSDEYISGDIAAMINSNQSNLNYELTSNFKHFAKDVEVTEEEKKIFHRPKHFINEKQNLPRLFTYQDSFFGELFLLVSEHFSNAFYINEYPCNINLEVVKKHQSNVVIQEFWEGRIETVLKSCKLYTKA